MEWDAPAFSERLEQALERKGVRASDVSQSAGVSETMLSHWRNGRRGRDVSCRCDSLFAVAKALEVSPAWLAYGESPAQPLTEVDQADLDTLARLSERHRAIVREVMNGFLPEDAGKPARPSRAARPARPGSARFESGQLLDQRLEELVSALNTECARHSDESELSRACRRVVDAIGPLSQTLHKTMNQAQARTGDRSAEAVEDYGALHEDPRSVDP